MAITDIFGGGAGGFTGMFGAVKTVGSLLVAFIILGLCALIVWLMWKKKKNYNLKVEVKIPRSDGKLFNSEWAKGEYNSDKGVVWIKRKKVKPVAMEPFDASKFLQGDKNILTVVQLAPDHYLPLAYESFYEVYDDKTKKGAVMSKMMSNYSRSKAWKNSFERERKQAFSIKNLLRDYAPYISIGMVIILWGIQFMVLYMKVT